MMNVLIKRDDIYQKDFEITSGDKRWWITVDRVFVDDYHALWRWNFSLGTGLVGNPPQWPTWERALEEALNHITRTALEAGD
jgi:hypothetical protein